MNKSTRAGRCQSGLHRRLCRALSPRGIWPGLVCLTVTSPVQGQTPYRNLPVVRDLELSGTKNDLSPISSVAVSQRGWIAVGQRDDNRILVFRGDGRPLFRFGRRGAGPGEFQMLGGFVGWVGDTLWATDVALRRLTFIHPDGTLLRTVRNPAPNSASRRIPASAPRQGEMYITGIGDNGTAMAFSSLVGVSIASLWRADPKALQSTIWLQSLDGTEATFLGFEPNRTNGCTEGAYSYYQIACPLTLTAFSPTGDRYVVARPGRVTAKDGSFWLTVTGTRGDSLVHRLVRYSGTPIPRSFVDSSKAACRARESTAARMAACNDLSHSPQLRYIHRVMLGLDRTIWLELQPDMRGRHWLTLSPTGEPIGRMTFPTRFFLWAASRTAAWGTETDADELENVVRYRIGR